MTPEADEPSDYETLYRTHHAHVLRLCRLLLKDPHEADDVSQEVFLKLLREHAANGRAMVWRAWLTRVTVNACRDRRRSGWWKRWRERHTEFQEDGFASSAMSPERAALGAELREQIWDSFRTLSARQREIFVLRMVEGWSTEQVAETLGLSAGSVKRHLFRAVHHLRTALRGQ